MADLAIRLATAPRPVLATGDGAVPIIGAPPAPSSGQAMSAPGVSASTSSLITK
jgi:hypothetical protein